MPPPMFGGKPCPGSFMEEIIGCFDICPGTNIFILYLTIKRNN